MEQLDFPFAIDEAKLRVFLAQVMAIENEQDRLREELRGLKEEYEPFFPMRGVLTAVKIIRATQKLADHPNEGMSPVHLACLRVLVEQQVLALQEDARLMKGIRLVVPDMTTGEVPA